MNVSNAELSVTGAGEGLLDLYATSLSALCLIHCLVLPLFASLLPVAGQLSENALAHRLLVLLAAPATFWAGWRSLSMIGGQFFIVVAMGGLGLLMSAAFVDALSAYELGITVTGALLLASAHLWRWARHRRGAPRHQQQCEADNSPGR